MTACIKRYVVEVPEQSKLKQARHEFNGRGANVKAIAKLSEVRSGGNQAYLRTEEFRGGKWVSI